MCNNSHLHEIVSILLATVKRKEKNFISNVFIQLNRLVVFLHFFRFAKAIIYLPKLHP